MNAIYERYLNDEEFRNSIVTAARRERMKAVNRLILQPLKALLVTPPLRATRMFHRSAAF
jgi:hypothetical protein